MSEKHCYIALCEERIAHDVIEFLRELSLPKYEDSDANGLLLWSMKRAEALLEQICDMPIDREDNNVQ